LNSLRKHILIYTVVLVAAVVSFVTADRYTLSLSKDTETCLGCHEDKDLVMEKDGKKISMFVSPDHYKSSVHSGAECTDCHLKYNPDEIPHTKTKESVNCGSCHDNLKGIEKSVHLKVNCYDCHTKHDIKPASQISKDQTKNCLNCHKKKNISQYSNSIHAKKEIGCEGCHQGGHQTKKISKSEVGNVCGKCHNKNKMAFNNSIHHTVLNNGNKDAPVCTDCHGAHEIRTSRISIQTEACLKCHLDEKLFPGSDRGSAKFVKEYRTSIHGSIQKGEKEAATCADCHGDHMIDSPDNPGASTKRARLVETCGKCHGEVVAKFKKSKHGQELLKNNEKAPTCSDCHGEHDIKSTLLSDEFSKISIADKCLGCHKDGKIPHKNYKGEEELISGYKKSVHYEALEKGNLDAPTCSECHGAHEMESADNPDSKISKKNMANTCGQSNCHGKQKDNYTGSVHEKGVMEGNKDAPTCNNCHGNHSIVTKKSDDKLAKSKSLIQLCSNCHSSVELTERNDLPVKVSETYNESFHGLATRGGSSEVANCESCHGYHNIKPSNDTSSTINKKNLPQTCGKCHPGATEVLFTSKIHVTDIKNDSPWVYLVTRFYMILIFGIIGFMVLHNLLDWRRKKAIKKTE
jgi:nitrate/TMAO reductase-like tetraheme cytochrome c subunit